jgi:hypothetical protein
MSEAETVAPDEADDDRDDRVYRRRLLGVPARVLAKEFGCTIADVNAAIDRKMVHVDNAYRIRMTALDLERLESMQMRFLPQALGGDLGAGHLVLKICERRSAMLGTDAPMRIDPIQLVVAQHPEDSTPYYERMITELQRDQRPAASEPGEEGEPKPN